MLEPLRNIHNGKFGAVIFRRQGVEIKKEGGLWDESQNIYSLTGGTSREGMLDWKWPSGARVSFSHLEQEKDKYTWQGAQIALIEFDELTHFTKSQFFYMLSRNRSTSGVRPHIRATTNPDADSWVAELIAWWIDQDTGYAIPERSGVIRYFVKRGEDIIWANKKEELLNSDVELTDIKSFTFVNSNVYDNKILLEKDPGYLANLKALSAVDRGRLLGGNWKIRPSAGLYFKRHYFEIVDAAPASSQKVRHWDLAATVEDGTNDPDYTVGVKMSKSSSGIFYIEDVIRERLSPKGVEDLILNTASQDGLNCTVSLPQDPGQAGKAQVQYLTSRLAGYPVKSERETGDKVTRASAASSQAEAGNMKLVRAPWNEPFISELVNFPNEGSHDDQVDATSGALNRIVNVASGQGYIEYYKKLAEQNG